ncbi:MAG: response regulator [Desulfatibacillaceae bacterium]
MDTVLIVDDETRFLNLISDALQDYNDKFAVITATDGEKAIERLGAQPVSVLVTDLQMPRVDGLALLSYMNENHPTVPCIVMTGHATPQVQKRLAKDVLHFIHKPFEVEELAHSILKALEEDTADGSLAGISLPSFVQLIEMEQKTCLFEAVAPDGRKGFFYFRDGVPYDAVLGNLKGEEAAIAIIAMDGARIHFKKLPKKPVASKIRNSLTNLVLEAMRAKDESEAGGVIGDDDDELDFSGAPDGEESVLSDHLGEGSVLDDDPGQSVFSDDTDLFGDADDPLDLEVPDVPLAGDDASLEQLLHGLTKVKGYRTSAIVSGSGEVLAMDGDPGSLDMAALCAAFNDVMEQARNAAGSTGLDGCRHAAFTTPAGVVMLTAPEVQSPAFHVLALLTAEGNQALARIRMEKLLPAIQAEVA